eukprot:g3992.t1
MVRSCAAFNCKSIFVIGTKKKLSFFGSKGTKKFVEMIFFPSLEACRSHCDKLGVEVLGVEIGKTSENVSMHPFSGPTAFLLGNEGQGLSQKEIDFCDRLVYIPHFGNGTHSLNVTVAASIVFHHFASFAGYPEITMTGAKFDIERRKKGVLTENELNIRSARKAKKAAKVAQAAANSALACCELIPDLN